MSDMMKRALVLLIVSTTSIQLGYGIPTQTGAACTLETKPYLEYTINGLTIPPNRTHSDTIDVEVSDVIRYKCPCCGTRRRCGNDDRQLTCGPVQRSKLESITFEISQLGEHLALADQCKDRAKCQLPILQYSNLTLKDAVDEGAVLEATCKPGYLVDHEEKPKKQSATCVCNDDGKLVWSHSFVNCIKAKCDGIGMPNGILKYANHSIHVPDISVEIGIYLKVYCDSGYGSADERMECELAPATVAGAQWSVIPQCTKIKCPGVELEGANGQLIDNKSGEVIRGKNKSLTIGSQLSVVCNKGFFPKNSLMQCSLLPDGTAATWDLQPICVSETSNSTSVNLSFVIPLAVCGVVLIVAVIAIVGYCCAHWFTKAAAGKLQGSKGAHATFSSSPPAAIQERRSSEGMYETIPPLEESYDYPYYASRPYLMPNSEITFVDNTPYFTANNQPKTGGKSKLAVQFV